MGAVAFEHIKEQLSRDIQFHTHGIQVIEGRCRELARERLRQGLMLALLEDSAIPEESDANYGYKVEEQVREYVESLMDRLSEWGAI